MSTQKLFQLVARIAAAGFEYLHRGPYIPGRAEAALHGGLVYERLLNVRYLAVWADGKNIRTLESLLGPNGELSDIQQAFIDEGAVQCGFCTPGFIMSAVEILESGKMYTRDELRKQLSGHLCRCTGYENIINAVEKTMKKRHGEP